MENKAESPTTTNRPHANRVFFPPPLSLPPPPVRAPRLKDGYLLENCLAVLVNLAPQAEHLQSYAAERLVSVLIAASRRWIQGASAAAAAAMTAQKAKALRQQGNGGRGGTSEGSGVGGGGNGNGEGGVMTEVDLDGEKGGGGEGDGGLSDVQELCGEVARVLFLFVWTCTRPRRLGGNVELLYALLHEQVRLVTGGPDVVPPLRRAVRGGGGVYVKPSPGM